MLLPVSITTKGKLLLDVHTLHRVAVCLLSAAAVALRRVEPAQSQGGVSACEHTPFLIRVSSSFLLAASASLQKVNAKWSDSLQLPQLIAHPSPVTANPLLLLIYCYSSAAGKMVPRCLIAAALLLAVFQAVTAEVKFGQTFSGDVSVVFG